MLKERLANDELGDKPETMDNPSDLKDISMKKDVFLIIGYTILYLIIGYFVWQFTRGNESYIGDTSSSAQVYWGTTGLLAFVYSVVAVIFLVSYFYKPRDAVELSPYAAMMTHTEEIQQETYRRYLSRFNIGVIAGLAPVIAVVIATFISMIMLQFV